MGIAKACDLPTFIRLSLVAVIQSLFDHYATTMRPLCDYSYEILIDYVLAMLRYFARGHLMPRPLTTRHRVSKLIATIRIRNLRLLSELCTRVAGTWGVR